jgi:2-polyprenyl-3-methyl-5-hydroxy-6-metoxy-1,4-benzoquinol methylase
MTYITKYIQPLIKPTDTVLDVCCGLCAPTRELICKSRVGIDLDPVALEVAKVYGPTIKYDVSRIYEILIPKSYDITIWLDGIEHLESGAALDALDTLEKVTRKTIIVFTPIAKAFFDHPKELLRHKSIFPEEFWKNRGYNTNATFKSMQVPMVLAWRNEHEVHP